MTTERGSHEIPDWHGETMRELGKIEGILTTHMSSDEIRFSGIMDRLRSHGRLLITILLVALTGAGALAGILLTGLIR